MKNLEQQINHELEGLDPESRQILNQIFSEVKDSGSSVTLNQLLEADFIRHPVSIDEFLDNPYYMGKYGKSIYDAWRKDLRDLFADEGIYEYIFTGALGIGKTTIAEFAMLYCIYRLSCLRDPVEYHGLMKDSDIVFGIYNVFKYKSEPAYNRLMRRVQNSPYFIENFPCKKTELVFPNNIKVITGSSDLGALGENLMCILLDEMNFMKHPDAGSELSQAHKLYDSTLRRLKSRFLTSGRIPGLMLLISSKKSETSFVETHIREIKTLNLKGAKISDYSLWDVKPENYSKITFRILIGNRFVASKILDVGETVPMEMSDRVFEIPIDFIQDFQRDIDGSIRDILGKSTIAVSPLIKDRKSVFDAVDKTRTDPFKKNPIFITTKDSIDITKYLDVSKLARVVAGVYSPKVDADAPRFLHVDVGLTGDSAGIAMSHVSRVDNYIDYTRLKTGIPVVKPHIYVDLLLSIRAPVVGEIDLTKIVDFIVYLNTLGYEFSVCSYDGFQSRHSIQMLDKTNIKAETFSVDRNDDAYITLKNVLADRCLEYYYHPVLLGSDTPIDGKLYQGELLELQHDINKGKVDHPHTNSKDLSDALAASVHKAYISKLSRGDTGNAPIQGDADDKRFKDKDMEELL